MSRYFFILLNFLLFTIPQISSAQSISWDQAIDVAPKAYGHNQPRITADANANPLIIWGHNGNLMFSRYDADTFTTPIALNANGDKVAQASWMSPSIAAKGNTIYVVYKELPEASYDSHIWIRRSDDGGKNFDDAYQVDNIGNHLSRFPTVTVDDDLNPLVAFMKFGPSFSEPHWVVTRSTNGGESFSSDTIAGNYSGSSAEACDCCPAVVRSKGDISAMIYRDNNQNLRDIWVGVSTDSGNSFPNGFNADNNNWTVPICPASAPDAFILGDSLYTCFMNAASGKNRVYLSRNNLPQAQWSRTSALPSSMPSFSEQNYPRMDNDHGSVALVYKEVRDAEPALIVHFSPNIAQALGSYTEELVATGVVNADVFLANNKIHVIWQDLTTGTVRYQKGDVSSLLYADDLKKLIPKLSYISETWQIDELEGSGTWSIFSLDGSMIDQGIFSSSSNKISIDHTDYSSGVYILKIDGYSELKVSKF